ncbi:MAG: hypothetical protein ABS942_06980 [Solibacillus sp.]|uniref:hypothetical protein n=1 Tax=Solibacillus sp. TaxID=1909654 RepID=UPI003315BE84
MELLMHEQLLKNPVCFKNQRTEALVQLLDSLEFQEARLLTKEDIQLIFYDVWAMLEIGAHYKNEVTTVDVKQKAFRLFLLEFFAKNEVLNKIIQQKSCTEKRFFIALLLGQKLVSKYLKRLEVLWEIHDTLQGEDQKQQKLVDVQRNWFQHLYKYEKELQLILYQVLKQLDAVEQVLGQDIWSTIKEDYFEALLKSIEMNHFDEILFWKNKLDSHPSVSLQTQPNCSYVFCIQQDASMRHYLNLQTALVAGIYETMEQKKVNFIFVPFAESIEKEIIALDGTLHVEQFFNRTQPNENKGRINYKNALNYALLMSKLELNKHETSRIYFLCNEEVYTQMPDDLQWQQAVRQFKEINNVGITAIYLGDLTKYRALWFADHAFSLEQILLDPK